MEFNLSFGMSISNNSLLELVNDWRRDCGDPTYDCIEDVPENEIYDIIYESGYLDTVLENVLIEEINVEKI